MILGIISILIGASFFIFGLTADPYGAIQQTTQFLLYVCGSIFVSTGFICISLHSLKNKNFANIEKNFKELQTKDEIEKQRMQLLKNPQNICKFEETDNNESKIKFTENEEWICPSCGAKNPKNDKRCWCGYNR